jgi:hypothetical protein
MIVDQASNSFVAEDESCRLMGARWDERSGEPMRREPETATNSSGNDVGVEQAS